jgi:AraC family transcriptional regulator
MAWNKNMERAVAYIEENLNGEVNIETAARLAGCSKWEFYRIFSFAAQISLGEYIRRRKLANALLDLQASGDKIIEVQPWGAIECRVTTLDGSVLRFFETT